MATNIKLKPGETYTLTLKGKGSAGYSWTYELSGDSNAVMVEMRGTGPPRDTSSKEGPGTYSVDERVIVKAMSAGEVTIRFVLRRSWEKDRPPLEEQTLKVTVRD